MGREVLPLIFFCIANKQPIGTSWGTEQVARNP